MIFIHLLLGIILGKVYGYFWIFILGSVFVDLDHIYVIFKNKLWNSHKVIQNLKFEKQFNIRFKTPFFHSMFGAILFSLILSIFIKEEVIYFFFAYLLHLLIDWIDIDDKYYLWPLKIKFNGVLPIWSKTEQVLTIILIIIILFLI